MLHDDASASDRTRPVGPAGEAALAFTEGARGGWLASDLAAWVQRHVLTPGFLVLSRLDLHEVVIEEPDAGRVALPTDRHPDRKVTSNARAIVELARERVELALCGLLPPARDDRFINAAIYSGRVQRKQTAIEPWVPTLDEGGGLSQWVLALFAADALCDRVRYDEALHVCDVCGAVGFSEGRRSRRRCEAHDVSPSMAPPRSTSRISAVPPVVPAVAEPARRR